MSSAACTIPHAPSPVHAPFQRRFLVFGKDDAIAGGGLDSGRGQCAQDSRASESESLTAVVYRMMQTRKKQTLGSSLSVPSSRASAAGGGASGAGRGGRLSVTFSLRRKTRKNAHKLQRIASENPNTQKRKVQPSSALLQTGSTGTLSDAPACHSSPDVRRQETPDDVSSANVFEFTSETHVDMQ